MKNVNAVFELKNITFDYLGKKALDKISLRIEKGERVAILGANGSGKSTLLKLLDGLYFATSGELWAFGKRLTKETFQNDETAYFFRKRVGFVFQDPDVQLFSPTVLDEVFFAPLHLGIGKKEAEEMVKMAMDVLEINHLKDRPPYLLSGGEKKKVALASILSYQPEVWLFDEPTLGLDPRSQSRFIDFIESLKNGKNTIITSTHELSIVENIADTVFVLSEGHELAFCGKSVKTLGNLPLLRKHNLLHEHKHRHDKKTHRHIHTHGTNQYLHK